MTFRLLARLAGGSFPLSLKTALVLLALHIASIGISPAQASDLLGGDDIIPINPDFLPIVPLEFTPDSSSDNRLFGIDDPSDSLNPLDGSQIARVFFGAEQLPFTPPSTALGAALSSSLSASNRPSVLTPYAGVIIGEGEEAVFDTFGSFSTNKATTLGRGKLGIGVSYQHAVFDEFDGKDIGEAFVNESQTDAGEPFSITGDLNLPIVDSRFPGEDLGTAEDLFQLEEGGAVAIKQQADLTRDVSLTARDVEFEVDIVTLSMTYGLLDNLDLGLLIPYLWLTARGEVTADINVDGRIDFEVYDITGVDPNSDTATPRPNVSTVGDVSGRSKVTEKFDDDYDGLGDIIVFTKFQILSEAGLPKRIEAPLDLALQFELKTASGDEDEFLGTGRTDYALRAIMQKQATAVLLLRGEIGYNYSGLGSEFSTIDTKLGVEYQATSRMSVSAEVINNYSDEFGNVLDAIVGGKYEISRDFRVFAGLRVPLNDDGLRFSWSPIVGAEYVFSPRGGGDFGDEEPMPVEEIETGQAGGSATGGLAGLPLQESGVEVASRGAPRDRQDTAPLMLDNVQSRHFTVGQPQAAPAPSALSPRSAAGAPSRLPLPSRGRI